MERGVVESALRQTPDQRHLTAFKPEPDAAARTRLLALVAFAAGLAVAGALAATEAFHAVLRTRPRSHIMKPDHDWAASFPSVCGADERMPRDFKIPSRRRNERRAAIVAFTTLA